MKGGKPPPGGFLLPMAASSIAQARKEAAFFMGMVNKGRRTREDETINQEAQEAIPQA